MLKSKSLPSPIRTTASGIASGVLFAASYGPTGWWPVGLVAFVPWLLWTRSTTERAIGGLIVGILCGLWIGRWIPQALQLAGSGEGASILALLILSALVALPMALVGLSLSLPLRAWSLILFAGFAGSGIDWARVVLPFVEPWGSIGHSQLSNLGLTQLAVLGGSGSLSGLVLAVNVWIAAIVRGDLKTARDRDFFIGLFVAVVGLGLVGLRLASLAHEESELGLDVLVVQPVVPREARWARSAQRTNLRMVTERTRRAIQPTTDIVLWPEMVLTTPMESDPRLEEDVLGSAKELGVPLIIGFARVMAGDPPGQYRNSVGWIDPERGLVSVVDKAIAVPLIESSGRFLGSNSLLRWLDGTDWGPLRVTEVSGEGRLSGDVNLAIAICYEIQFPGLVASRMEPDSFAIVNLSNEGWIGSEPLSRILLGFSRLRAIEQRSYVIRSTDSGASAVIDPMGRIVAEVPYGTRGEITARVTAAGEVGLPERLVPAGSFVVLFGVGWSGSRLLRRFKR